MLSRSPVKRLLALASALLLAAVFVIAATSTWQITHADALWRIVHGGCVPDMQLNHVASPCVSVDLSKGVADGVAVLKDVKGNTQYLIIPTKKITGIESSAILEPTSVNYFSDAWEATDLVSQRLHHTLERTDFAVAINSVSGRSQNQLHIHVDCIQPEVKLALQQIGPEIQTTWQTLPVKLMGHEYRALWIPGSQLGSQNPFDLLAASLHNPAHEMGGHTLVLAGAERSNEAGFILLDRKAPTFAVAISPWLKLGLGSGEELEDHHCRLANGPQ
jgi:CDP-diacylglycerol pyrophosphatase